MHDDVRAAGTPPHIGDVEGHCGLVSIDDRLQRAFAGRAGGRIAAPTNLRSMSTTADHLQDPELLQTEWDLAPLVDGEDDAGVDRLLAEAKSRADPFAARYAGTVVERERWRCASTSSGGVRAGRTR